MDILTILYTIFIQPLQLVFEVIFNTANKFTNHPGLSIIALSIIINFLVLPLYKRADDMQEKQRDIENKLKRGIDHIKKTFTGDERMMILQTYYRQNNYKPTDALNGSISLLLEIPFFIAAYQFLSHLSILTGVSLGPIQDLSQPDAIFTISGMTINVLPILMTLINVVSSAIYLKGFPLKTKIQLYGMSLFFLVFLYESPSGLVFYWTLNNLFSLVKNVFYKLKNPENILSYILSLCGLGLIAFVVLLYDTNSIKCHVFLLCIGIILELPLLFKLIQNKVYIKNKTKIQPYYHSVFLSGLLIAIFVGLYIPSSVISSSPEEFLNITYFHNPLLYLVQSFSLSVGFFIVWVGVFYWISNLSFKLLFEKSLWGLSIVFIVNYMFFGTKLGTILPNLQYENGIKFTMNEIVINILVIVILFALLTFIINKYKKHVVSILCICVLAFAAMSGYNIYNINSIVSDYQEKVADASTNIPHFNLSKEGKNVVVLLLDRGMNSHVQYIFNEKPELKKQFAGFTHYTNVISHGGYTNFGTPGVFGGYEYTPLEMNKRNEESLVSKHNEALKVLPLLYNENNYNVTVCDPSYANYGWVPDLSIYDNYSDIKTYITEGKFTDKNLTIAEINNNYRNFFCFSVMKTMPLLFQNSIYDSGNYHKIANFNSRDEIVEYNTQTVHNQTTSTGILNSFMRSYNVLVNLDTMTHINDGSSNNFLMMVNNSTHEPMMLQTPDYVPRMNVDNTYYMKQNKDVYTINGQTLKMETKDQITHYHANMASFIQLGKWFDYLRANDVYDNTKIILVSDHGKALMQVEQLIMGDEGIKDIELYYPLLMVKDFNSKVFTVSDEFMTNADVPTLALQDTIDNPVNPFTGKNINSSYKKEHDQYVIRSSKWRINENNGNTYLPSTWAIVKENMWKKENWTFIDEEIVNPVE